MFTRIGRKLMQGATEKLEENPPTILDQNKWMDLLETGLTLGMLALTILAGFKGNKQPVTVIVNNYITKG